VAETCGNLTFPPGTTFSMSLSDFIPGPSGVGGAITILLNGLEVAVWDAMDLEGEPVPNGHYHFILEETDAQGRIVLLERDAYIGARTGEASTLSAVPNISVGGANVVFTASLTGIPADAQSRIKLYTTGGELVRTLVPSAGTVTWDLTSRSGRTVASGLYLAVLEGPGAVGDKLHKVVKVLVLR